MKYVHCIICKINCKNFCNISHLFPAFIFRFMQHDFTVSPYCETRNIITSTVISTWIQVKNRNSFQIDEIGDRIESEL